MTRSIAIFLTTLTITGCSLFPSLFDANEHARIVNIHVISVDDKVCENRDAASRAADQMYQDARWVWHYGQFLADNDKMVKMESELMGMTKEFSERYHKADAVSTFYCRNKMENIKKATDAMIKVSARRPRS